MKKTRYLAISACMLSLASVSCEKVPDAEGSLMQDSGSGKIIYSSENAKKGELLLYLDSSEIPGYMDDSSGKFSIEPLFAVSKSNSGRMHDTGLDRWHIARFDRNADLDSMAAAFASMENVSRVQFNRELSRKAVKCTAAEPEMASSGQGRIFNDPGLGLQWHYINTGDKSISSVARAGADINCAEAWKLETGDPRIVVAIVDEGVQYTHEDLAANMWVNTAEKEGTAGTDDDGNGYRDDIHGYNFVDDGPVTWDKTGDSGHGTHVAGTVAAVNNNNIGVCGIAGGDGSGNGVRLMSCQIFSNGTGGASDIMAKALHYAADNGACIAQCSFGFDSGFLTSDSEYETLYSVEYDAIKYFISARNTEALDGGLVIFAAGNEGSYMAGYPGAYHDFISVAAVSTDGLPAYYTNYGPGVKISAPGGDFFEDPAADGKCQVYSTMPDGYGHNQGTSMACPHVSGIAALGLSYALELGKSFTVDEFKSMILSSVNGIDEYLTGYKDSQYRLNLSNYRNRMGTGTADAYQLLMNVKGTPCYHISSGSTQYIGLGELFGDGKTSITVTGVEISPEDMEKLKVEGEPTVFRNRLIISCARPGCAVFTVKAIAGGDTAGGGDQIGGMEISKEIAVIVRGYKSGNGGWL